MTAIEQRLQFLFDADVIAYSDAGKSQAFTDYLIQHNKQNQFHQLVLDHRMLNLENDVYREHLVKNHSHYSAEELRIKINNALKFAELLEMIYRQYLTVDRVADRFRQEQAMYRSWLRSQDSYAAENPHPGQFSSLAKNIRTRAEQLNFWRLLAVRSRRLLLLLVPIIQDLLNYRQSIATLEIVLAPIAMHQGWIFFIPRLSTNLFLVAKHSVHSLMHNHEEKSLDSWLRLRAQMDIERRWWEIANDTMWFSCNFTNAFVLTGALAPFAFYVTLFLPLHDALLSSLRAYVEISRLNTRRQDSLTSPDSDSEENRLYRAELEKRIHFEQAQLFQRITMNSLMFVAMALAIPFIAINPIIPMLGALLAVITTIVGRILSESRVNPETKGAQDSLRDRLQQTLDATPLPAAPSPLQCFGLFAPPPLVELDTVENPLHQQGLRQRR